jgi:hypothetical protein
MVRRSIAVVGVAAVLSALLALPAGAFSIPHPPQPAQLTVSGFVVGRVAKGDKVRFGIVAFDPRTWTDLESVKVVFLLRGQVLEELAFFVKGGKLAVGSQAPVDISSPTPVSSGFFRVVPHTLRMIRHAFSIRVTLWARIQEGLPKGTIFRAVARDDAGRIAYAKEDVKVYGGFLTWGTFTIGFALALLIGALIVNERWARRYRTLRPSIWDVLDRRLKEERARPPALVAARGDGGVA